VETCREEGTGYANAFPMFSSSSSLIGLTHAWNESRRERLRPLKCSADLSGLRDLVESGVLVHRKRRADYVVPELATPADVVH